MARHRAPLRPPYHERRTTALRRAPPQRRLPNNGRRRPGGRSALAGLAWVLVGVSSAAAGARPARRHPGASGRTPSVPSSPHSSPTHRQLANARQNEAWFKKGTVPFRDTGGNPRSRSLLRGDCPLFEPGAKRVQQGPPEVPKEVPNRTRSPPERRTGIWSSRSTRQPSPPCRSVAGPRQRAGSEALNRPRQCWHVTRRPR